MGRAVLLAIASSAFASAAPEQASEHQAALEKLFSAVIGHSGGDTKGLFTPDATYVCDPKCVEADWCPCKKHMYKFSDFLKEMSSFTAKVDIKIAELDFFPDMDGKTVYTKSDVCMKEQKPPGKEQMPPGKEQKPPGKEQKPTGKEQKPTGTCSPQRHFMDIITFDDSGKISKAGNSLPHQLSADQSKLFKQSFDDFSKGDIGSTMDLFSEDVTFLCDKRCVDADWCMCTQTSYDRKAISQRMSLMSKDFAAQKFKDLTVDGQKLTKELIEKREMYSFGNTLLNPYTLGGMYNGKQIPQTSMLEVYNLDENSKITQVKLLIGAKMKLDLQQDAEKKSGCTCGSNGCTCGP